MLGYEHTSSGLMAGEIEAGTQLWSTVQLAVQAIPAVADVAPVDQAVVAVELSVGAVQQVARTVQPVTGVIAQSAGAVDRVSGGILSAADPAVRTLTSRLDFRSVQLSNGTTRPWNVPLVPMLLVAFGLLTLLCRRRVV